MRERDSGEEWSLEGKEKLVFWVLSCPLSSNRGQDTDTQSHSRWHRSLTAVSCSGRAWEKLASLRAAGAFARLPAPSVMPEGLGG